MIKPLQLPAYPATKLLVDFRSDFLTSPEGDATFVFRVLDVETGDLLDTEPVSANLRDLCRFHEELGEALRVLKATQNQSSKSSQ